MKNTHWNYLAFLLLSAPACEAAQQSPGAKGSEEERSVQKEPPVHSSPTHPPDAAKDHDEPNESGEKFRLSRAAQTRGGVVLEQPRRGPWLEELSLPAEVKSDPDKLVHITPLIQGQLTRVDKTIGDKVKKGEVLAVMRSVQLGEAHAELQAITAELEVAKATWERQQQLFSEKVGSEKALIEAAGAYKAMQAKLKGKRSEIQVYGQSDGGALSQLTSPLAGEVVERHASVGETVGPDAPLFLVADTREVWVHAQAYPRDLGQVFVGQKARFESESTSATGTIDWIAPIADEKSRTIPLIVRMANEEGLLRPHSFGRLYLEPKASENEEQLSIASDAIVREESEEFVYVAEADGEHFRRQRVVTRGAHGARRAVQSGLEANDRYVSEGVFLLQSVEKRDEVGHGHAH